MLATVATQTPRNSRGAVGGRREVSWRQRPAARLALGRVVVVQAASVVARLVATGAARPASARESASRRDSGACEGDVGGVASFMAGGAFDRQRMRGRAGGIGPSASAAASFVGLRPHGRTAEGASGAAGLQEGAPRWVFCNHSVGCGTGRATLARLGMDSLDKAGDRPLAFRRERPVDRWRSICTHRPWFVPLDRTLVRSTESSRIGWGSNPARCQVERSVVRRPNRGKRPSMARCPPQPGRGARRGS